MALYMTRLMVPRCKHQSTKKFCCQEYQFSSHHLRKKNLYWKKSSFKRFMRMQYPVIISLMRNWMWNVNMYEAMKKNERWQRINCKKACMFLNGMYGMYMDVFGWALESKVMICNSLSVNILWTLFTFQRNLRHVVSIWLLKMPNTE